MKARKGSQDSAKRTKMLVLNTNPTIRVGRGQRVVRGTISNAEYVDAENPNYAGNPCIEALPAWLNIEDAHDRAVLLTELTTSHPDDGQLILGRSKGALTRLRLLYDIRRFFELLPQHLALELLIQGALHEGLVGRNPLDKRFTDSVWDDIKVSSQEKNSLPPPVIKSLGFFLGGGTGSGKTTAAERIALLYPQVIRHTRYQETQLVLTQIVWLFVETPKDGSPNTLIKNIFGEIDDILGTTYTEELVEKARDKTYGGLKRRLRKVLANHCVGMIFLDEVQHFFEASEKKQSDAEVMNTLVEMTNTLNVPMILIGTYKAHALFKHDARQGRRNVGCPSWEYMEYEECIETEQGLRVKPGLEETGYLQFMQALWRIQYTSTTTPLSKELYDAFYNITLGVADVVCKLFMLAQARIIASGIDTDSKPTTQGQSLITPELLKDIYQEAFHLLHPALSTLKAYKVEMQKSISDRDGQALTKARDILSKLGDVILPEEYMNMQLERSRRQIEITGDLRAIKERALTTFELHSILAEQLKMTGVESLMALEAAFETLRRNPHECNLEMLTAISTVIAQEMINEAAAGSKTQKTIAPSIVKPPLKLLELILSGEASGVSPVEALYRAGKVLPLITLKDNSR